MGIYLIVSRRSALCKQLLRIGLQAYVAQVRALVQDAFEGFGELGDDLGFLLRGNAITRDAQADKGHGNGSSGRPSK